MVTSFETFKTTSHARLFLPCSRQVGTVLVKQEILFNLNPYILYGAFRQNTMRIIQKVYSELHEFAVYHQHSF